MSITMTTVILFAVFGVLLFLGVPISISIVASSIVTAMSTLSWDQITFITMQKMNSGVESFSLLAVPLFILAGNIMNQAASPSVWWISSWPFWASCPAHCW